MKTRLLLIPIVILSCFFTGGCILLGQNTVDVSNNNSTILVMNTAALSECGIEADADYSDKLLTLNNIIAGAPYSLSWGFAVFCRNHLLLPKMKFHTAKQMIRDY